MNIIVAILTAPFVIIGWIISLLVNLFASLLWLFLVLFVLAGIVWFVQGML